MRPEELRRRRLFSSCLILSWLLLASSALAEEAQTAEETDGDATEGSTTTTDEGEPAAPESTDDGAAEQPATPPAEEDEQGSGGEQAQPEVPEAQPPTETPSTATETVEPVDLVERVRGSMVEIRTAWTRGVGFLVGDRRTVVYLGGLRHRYRRITARMAGGNGDFVRVAEISLSTTEEVPFAIIRLEAELSGTPLELSDTDPGIGDQVSLVIRRGHDRYRERRQVPGRGLTVPPGLEAAAATITTSSANTFTVGTATAQIWDGAPVFDDLGRVLGFFGREAYAVHADHILSTENHRPGRALAAPIFGVRIGTEFEGMLDDPFVLDIELGVALWDQLAFLFRLGFAFGSEVLYRIPASGGRETGVVEGDQRAVNLGLEVKYRLLLNSAAMPLYFDIVAGGVYTMTVLDPNGLAFYATDSDCDPFAAGCNLAAGQAPTRATEHGVGPVFGFDIRAGVFTMGYRIVASAISHNLPNSHRLTFGVTYR